MQPIGVVSKRYTPIQNTEILATAKRLTQEGYRLNKSVVQGGGMRVIVHMVHEKLEAGNVQRNVYIVNTNTGIGSLIIKQSHVQMVCTNQLNGIIPVDPKKKLDMYAVLSRLLDASKFHEFKEKFGPTLITGFGHLYGNPVGIVANNGVLFAESAQKGAHFISLCGQRKVPLIFLQNITGFMVGK
jgi:predicted RNA binding protein YcfA (HicA-like mRNA interferase family)